MIFLNTMRFSCLMPQRPMYQPSGESDKENKRLEAPQSPSSSDRSLNDQPPPPLSRYTHGHTNSQNNNPPTLRFTDTDKQLTTLSTVHIIWNLLDFMFEQ